ncbi:MAG: hypothetical protein ACRYG4_04375 [Janthinobacterium lividum]
MLIEVGHGPFRQRWSAAIDRITKFVAVGPAGSVDRRADLKPPSNANDAEMRFGAAGRYIVVLETTHADSVLPGIRFTDYITAEGITPAIATRAKAGLTDSPGRELYSRRAKAQERTSDRTVARCRSSPSESDRAPAWRVPDL